jgi:hypothetical protein
VETQQEVQPKRIKLALEDNETTQNLEVAMQLDELQMTISGQRIEGTTTNSLTWLEWLMGEQLEVDETLKQPPQQKDRVQILSSPCKKPAAEIVLPRIPAGIQVEPELLGHVRKLKYFDHDVSDETKFP